MATGIAVGQANLILDALCRSIAFDPTAFYLKLHLARPGVGRHHCHRQRTPQGSRRRSRPRSVGAITNSAAVTWTSMTAAETISHWSAWDTVGPAGGTFLFSDNFTTPRLVAIGDTFEIPIGDLDIDITVLAA